MSFAYVKVQGNTYPALGMACFTNKFQVLSMPVEHGPPGNTGLWPSIYFLWQSAKDSKNKSIRRNCPYGLKKKMCMTVETPSAFVES